ERPAVDEELARAVRRDRSAPDETGGDRSDAEGLVLRIVADAHREPIEWLRTHRVRPPHERVGNAQRDGDGAARVGTEMNDSVKRPRASALPRRLCHRGMY